MYEREARPSHELHEVSDFVYVQLTWLRLLRTRMGKIYELLYGRDLAESSIYTSAG